jgi:AIG2-like family
MRSATGSAMLYFAYGSNMSTPRLRYRVPGCRFTFVARLPNYKLCFHKRSNDGSAKCNAFGTAKPTDAVIGAVYEIPTNEKPALDNAEGLGSDHHEEIVRVLSPKGEEVAVRTYIADGTFIDESLQPYSWYKDFVLAGAEEHKLPPEYVEGCIRAVHAIRDPDPQREQKRRAEIKA